MDANEHSQEVLPGSNKERVIGRDAGTTQQEVSQPSQRLEKDLSSQPSRRWIWYCGALLSLILSFFATYWIVSDGVVNPFSKSLSDEEFLLEDSVFLAVPPVEPKEVLPKYLRDQYDAYLYASDQTSFVFDSAQKILDWIASDSLLTAYDAMQRTSESTAHQLSGRLSRIVKIKNDLVNDTPNGLERAFHHLESSDNPYFSIEIRYALMATHVGYRNHEGTFIRYNARLAQQAAKLSSNAHTMKSFDDLLDIPHQMNLVK